MRRTRLQPGMTLVEVLVAMVVASVVAGIGYGAFATLTDQSERITENNDQEHAAEVRRLIANWLHSAVLEPGIDASVFRGLDAERDDMSVDEVNFVTAAPTPLNAAMTAVRIFIDDDSTTVERGLVAEFREFPGAQMRRIILDSMVEGIDTRYRSGLVAERGWLPSWVSSSVLPDAAELQFIGTRLDPLLALPLVVTVGPPK